MSPPKLWRVGWRKVDGALGTTESGHIVDRPMTFKEAFDTASALNTARRGCHHYAEVVSLDLDAIRARAETRRGTLWDSSWAEETLLLTDAIGVLAREVKRLQAVLGFVARDSALGNEAVAEAYAAADDESTDMTAEIDALVLHCAGPESRAVVADSATTALPPEEATAPPLAPIVFRAGPDGVPRMGGPERCPRPCSECSDNPGTHHFSEAIIGYATDDRPPEGMPVEVTSWFGCKHCAAWLEWTDDSDYLQVYRWHPDTHALERSDWRDVWDHAVGDALTLDSAHSLAVRDACDEADDEDP